MRNDYIMDMIEDFGTLLQNLRNKITHNEEISTVNHDAALGDAGLFGIMIKRKSAAGEINEAENMLFDEIEKHPEPDYFYVALDFYKEISALSDKKLAECNFLRSEIKEGMSEILKLAAENGITQEQL